MKLETDTALRGEKGGPETKRNKEKKRFGEPSKPETATRVSPADGEVQSGGKKGRKPRLVINNARIKKLGLNYRRLQRWADIMLFKLNPFTSSKHN